ncbi:MAG TPA: polyprenyl synthetase family protein [Burkholderiales bacterium]|nr:polyprenyl synthetase family protein [Burkholderiales bacterium]
MARPHAAPFSGTDDRVVAEVLSEYGKLTRDSMQDYLPQAEPNSYLYELLGDYPRRGGKMLRSSLCIAMARATGAEVEEVIDTAVSIELLHNALLVHDDIEDGSDERRGTPTLHALHGIPLALNAGDAMGLLSLRPLKQNFHRLGIGTALRIFEETERMAWESTEGQALELGWQRDNRTDVTAEDYLQMVLQKTCWLAAIYPLRVGCLIGARGRLSLEPLLRIGFFYGAAFQIQDDLLNLEGGAAYGKEINGDLFEGKRTLMIIHALRAADAADRTRLTDFLGLCREERTAGDVAWVRDLLDRTGAYDYARTLARALAGAALFEFDRYFAKTRDSRDLRFMRALLTWVMERSH